MDILSVNLIEIGTHTYDEIDDHSTQSSKTEREKICCNNTIKQKKNYPNLKKRLH